MPLLEFEISSLTPSSEYLLANSEYIRQYYDENMMDGVDVNQLVVEALESMPYSDDFMYLMINWANFNNRLLRRPAVSRAIMNSDKRTFYLITFTSDSKKTEEQNIIDITRYRINHFKKYKYVWVEEKESAESKRYHQHILIECPARVARTDQNLKPAEYYKGNVNVRKATPTKASIDRMIKDYFSKENKPKGDLEYFLNLKF